jgi:hypothetical protein
MRSRGFRLYRVGQLKQHLHQAVLYRWYQLAYVKRICLAWKDFPIFGGIEIGLDGFHLGRFEGFRTCIHCPQYNLLQLPAFYDPIPYSLVTFTPVTSTVLLPSSIWIIVFFGRLSEIKLLHHRQTISTYFPFQSSNLSSDPWQTISHPWVSTGKGTRPRIRAWRRASEPNILLCL